MNVIRETFEVNRRALELGCEPPVCLTWRVYSYPSPYFEVGPSDIGLPAQSIDHQRLAAFRRMMYEISNIGGP